MTTKAQKIPVKFWFYQFISPPTEPQNAVQIDEKYINFGNLEEPNPKTLPELALETAEGLSLQTQDLIAQHLTPDFASFVDQDKVESTKRALVVEFREFLKKCNFWLTPGLTDLTKQVQFSHYFPSFSGDNSAISAELSNIRKGLAFTSVTFCKNGDYNAFTKLPAVKSTFDLVNDFRNLVSVVEEVQRTGVHIINFYASIAERNLKPHNVASDQELKSYHKTTIDFFKMLVSTFEKGYKFTSKKTSKFMKNIITPKFQRFIDEWSTTTMTKENVEKSKVYWSKRLTYLTKANDCLKPYLNEADPWLPIAQYPIGLLDVHLVDFVGNVENLDLMLQTLSEKFDGSFLNPVLHYGKDSLLVAVELFPMLKTIIGESDNMIQKISSELLMIEEKIKPASKIYTYPIINGEIQPPCLISETMATIKTHCNREGDLVIIQKDEKISIYDIFDNRESSAPFLTEWPCKLEVPNKNYEVQTILTKSNWLVVTISPRISSSIWPKSTDKNSQNIVNKVACNRKLQYILISQMDRERKSVTPWEFIPSYGISGMSFLEDNSALHQFEDEKARTDNSLFILMYDMHIFQIRLDQKKCQLVTTMSSSGKEMEKMLVDGIQSFTVRAYSYYVLTNFNANGGSYISGNLRRWSEKEKNKIECIALQEPKSTKIVSVADQGHILAVGMQNGTIQLMDKQTGKATTDLTLFGDKLGEKELSLVKSSAGLSKLVFNSNDEILFYCKFGACLSWKINVPK